MRTVFDDDPGILQWTFREICRLFLDRSLNFDFNFQSSNGSLRYTAFFYTAIASLHRKAYGPNIRDKNVQKLFSHLSIRNSRNRHDDFDKEDSDGQIEE